MLAHTSRRLEQAKVATAVVFFLNGVTFATWVSRIPDARDHLGLSPGQLGLVLLALSAGSIVGLPSAGAVCARFGATRAVRLSGLACVSGMVGAGWAVASGSTPGLAACLFLFGLGMGVWDVSMNLHGAAVEHDLDRSVMPRFHAAFSLGTVAAALVGSGVAGARWDLRWHFMLAAVLILSGTAWALRAFMPSAGGRTETEVQPDEAGRSVGSAWRERRTLLIGLVVLVAAFTEGTANDWMSVAFVDGYHLPSWAGVLAFATFLSAMTAGRLIGTNLIDRFGRVVVMRILFACAGMGSVLVLSGPLPAAFVGAAIWGIGASLGFPVGISAAADEPARAAARLSVVSTIGYTAFLAGPPLLGFLGDRVGILRSLAVVAVLLLPAFLALPAVRPPQPD